MAQALALLAAPRLPSSGEMLREVRSGLLCAGQKTLPCKYFYDEVGSLLFEAICALPEYGLTAADSRLLQAHATEMLRPLGAGVMVAELGSGSARKTRSLLAPLCRRGPTRYWPIEISPLALERSQRELAALQGLRMEPIAAEYLEGLQAIARRRSQPQLRQRPLLVLFLGSTLGNFPPAGAMEFLREVRALLQPGDGLLLGLDLVKPAAQILRAYDDGAGVTAAFNRNLLVRLNRELGTDFDVRVWQHRAIYRERQQRVEMHLRARQATRVYLPEGGEVAFRRGETIWTESSHKFRAQDIGALVGAAGFRLARQWCDQEWPFAENLCLAC